MIKIGEWKQNVKHGKGIYTHSNANIYEGIWKNNTLFEKILIKYVNGDKYTGKYIVILMVLIIFNSFLYVYVNK